jgi:DHA1 family multidrug resistance protein-like MFS transporter
VVVNIVSRKYSERRILLTAIPVLGLVILLHPFVYSEIIIYTIVPLVAISFGLINTTLPAIISKGVGKDRQGAALGLNGSLQALSQGLAPLLAGSLAGVFGITSVFLIGGAFVFAAFFTVRSK